MAGWRVGFSKGKEISALDTPLAAAQHLGWRRKAKNLFCLGGLDG